MTLGEARRYLLWRRSAAHGAAYLGPEHSGVQMEVRRPEKSPSPLQSLPNRCIDRERKSEFHLLAGFGKLFLAEYPTITRFARIK